ncbi:DUF456 domain-containing protein [Flavobacterium sp. CS20]|uniref:DUF456 domain-containing protein n=1 Tax=Flavobacterium sp. CS20 TaxID=2775246 RepID=UPI001B39EFCC|nr:DUF456 domain-containing protein [Flavobacterium sp. CS20]QTY27755.1 hypothetical protein IGB25_04305 [Flavobacterium sp. CS20]
MLQVTNEIDTSLGILNNIDASNFENEDQVMNYILPLVENRRTNDINYFDTEWYLDNVPNFDNEISLEDVNLSSETLNYFNLLIQYYDNSDYEALLSLKDEYIRNFDANSDMISLATTFAVIDYFEDDLINSFTTKSSDCAPDGGTTAGASIGGAILGARVGFMFGSFLGPAGTVAGTVGGAIVGSLLSTIVSIGVQGVACEAGWW